MATQGKHMSTKALLGGILAGTLAFGCGAVALELALPAQDRVGTGRIYNYECSGAKSNSVAFNTSADAAKSVLLFGSSELSTSESTIPQVPQAVLGDNDYGVDVTFVGEAFDQSLWHAIAMGAYSPTVQNGKAVIIVSPTWFKDGGLDNETFGLRFSYSLYRAFCSNPNISEGSKSYVAKRLEQQGIDSTRINAGLKSTPIDALNDAALSAMDDLSVRKELNEVREGGIYYHDKTPAASTPSFAQQRAAALEDAQANSTNNDWGMLDSFYAKNIEGSLERLKDKQAGETYSDTPEYDDFTFFCKVCRECGIEPLVVISPVHGKFYDWEGVSKKDRKACYERIRSICQKQGVQYADFSDREYEDYFLFDNVHFGWTGWIDVEEAIVDYASK